MTDRKVGDKQIFVVSITNGLEPDNGKLRHYVDSNMANNKDRFFPDTFKATGAKIRFGAYRCKGRKADILWRNMGINFKND